MADAPADEILLVVNPTSGRGRGRRWAERARERLEAEGRRTRLSDKHGEAGELLAKEPGRFAESWVFGGDGTIRALLDRLPDGALPRLAIFPTGTGNVVARDLRIPRDFEGAWRIARDGALRRFDVLRVNDGRASFMASAGLDAELAHHVAATRRGPMRRTDWVRAAFASRSFAREQPFTVSVDGRDLGRAAYAAIFNCGLYAGSFRVAPRARFDDGKLEVLLLREPLRPRWVRVVWAAFRGRLERLPDATWITADAVELRDVACSQVDGDPGPKGTLRVTVEPGALLVHAPA
jgi:diacylglycerol kinase (ATP)